MIIVNELPQRRSTVGACDISSVSYDIMDDDGVTVASLDETCLFWQNGDTRIVGNYDAHDTVVTTLNAARDNA